jgi:hypothetical protein
MQPAIYPQKPMPFAPVVHRKYRDCDCLFWRHRGKVVYILKAEHDRYLRDHKKRIPREECGAEYWRSLVDLLMIPNNSPDRAQIVHEAQTWHRFATTDHAFTGGHQ